MVENIRKVETDPGKGKNPDFLQIQAFSANFKTTVTFRRAFKFF